MKTCIALFVVALMNVTPSALSEEASSAEAVKNAVEKAQQGAKAGPFQPTWESLVQYEIPEWYQDAKFGIFIHWGLYCVPAYQSEWYPRWMYIDKDTPRGNAFQHHRKTYGEGPTTTATGHLSENKNKAFTAEDIRFTTKGDTLYAIALAWPESGAVTVKSLKQADSVGKVQLLGSKAQLKWSLDKDGLKITLTETKPCDHAFVFKIEE